MKVNCHSIFHKLCTSLTSGNAVTGLDSFTNKLWLHTVIKLQITEAAHQTTSTQILADVPKVSWICIIYKVLAYFFHLEYFQHKYFKTYLKDDPIRSLFCFLIFVRRQNWVSLCHAQSKCLGSDFRVLLPIGVNTLHSNTYSSVFMGAEHL